MIATLGPSKAVDVDVVASRDAVAMVVEGYNLPIRKSEKGVAVVVFGKESPEFCVYAISEYLFNSSWEKVYFCFCFCCSFLSFPFSRVFQ